MRQFLGALLIIIFFSCSSKKEQVPIGLLVSNLAPDFESVSPKDSIIKLSSLQGNLVLLDFWASWCGPCRYENRNLILTVEKFSEVEFPGKKKKNTKGFKVFNVSLDSNKEAWKSAIQQDQLNWPYHVSDLKGWGSVAASLYRVNSIPTNFLIDAKGVILARNLRGQSLDEFLENYRIKK